MIHSTPHTLVGLFALLTVLLAGAAIGRMAGMGVGETLYLKALLLIVIGTIVNRIALRHKQPTQKVEE